MTIHLFNTLHMIFVVQASFGALLIANKKQYRGLVALLLGSSLLMIFNILEENDITRSIHLVTPSFALVQGPLFFLFIRQLVFSEKPLSRRDGYHLLPALLSLPLTHWVQSILFVGSVSQVIYIVVSLKLVKRYHTGSTAFRSDAHSLRIDWASKVLTMFIVIGAIDLIRLNLQPYLGFFNNQQWYFFNQLSYLLLVSYLIFKSVRQPDLFDGLSEIEAVSDTHDKQSAEDIEHSKTIFKAVDEHLQTTQDFKKPRFSLRDLSAVMGLHEKELSNAINTGSGNNFCDYINRLRIEAFKKSLVSCKQHVKLLELAFNCGFNSKSTFNAVFKKETGMTPTQFLASLPQ